MSSLRHDPFPLNYSNAGNPALISFFNAVYAWMASGLAITAIVAWWLSNNLATLQKFMSGGAMIGIFIAQIVLVVTIASAVNKLNAAVATVLFLIYAALNGITMSFIFLVYTKSSIAATFLSCAVMFGAMSVYGMVTKRDLTSMGRFLFMGLIGIVVASVINIFTHSQMLEWLISFVGVIVFVGLTAYDTQRLRELAISLQGDAAMSARIAVSGALMLYLDFINLFIFLLQFMGKQRQD